jgi:hypothetical protein
MQSAHTLHERVPARSLRLLMYLPWARQGGCNGKYADLNNMVLYGHQETCNERDRNASLCRVVL